jgi:ABC-type phosphate transport system substrate-binding protein
VISPPNSRGTGRGLVVLALALLPFAVSVPAFADASLKGTANPATAGVSSGPVGSPTSTSEAGPPAPGGTSTTIAPAPSSDGTSPSTTTTDVPPISSADPLLATTTIIGSGSSFAGPEVQQWTTDTSKAPYNLTVDYDSTSSGDGRYNFGNNTIDYAVSDIPYQGPAFDTKQPNFPFIYVPVTAGGLSFMYHLDGFSKTLQLSSYSACAIFTGGVQMWNDPIIQADNPGVTLPAVPVRPVIRTDLAGTNFVFQEYCIDEQPALWKAFVDSPVTRSYSGQVGDLSDSQPRSDWPLFNNAIEQSGSASAADTVAEPQDNGYVTAVETAYALERHFPVASVKNASGYYTQPGPVNVASALAYATQNANGTHSLNFGGTGEYVYNPSTYSYLLTPTTGWNQSKGYTMSQFTNYALTIGQQKATEIGYASLGLSLEQYGVNAIRSQVPGAVAPTAAEQQAYACGDLTVPEVQAGQQQPACGVLNTNNTTVFGQAASGGGASPTTTGTGASTSSPNSRTSATTKGGSGGSSAGSGGSSGGSGGSSGGSGGSSVDPGVSLGSSPALPTTGGAPLPVVVTGAALAAVGFLARRRLRTRIDARR